MEPVLRLLDRAGRLTDRELLDRYRSGRDERAFAALVARHGPLVLGACRRLLRHHQDAEDAFQATFLVLARQANAVRSGTSLGSWLYGVAVRLASQARRADSRRRCREQVAARPLAAPGETDRRELLCALDEELGSLPERLRAPLLCQLAGLTQEDAARRLGWSYGTYRRRLGQGRERLRLRLERRGLAWAAPLAAPASVRVPPTLAEATVRAAGRSTLAGAVSDRVIALTEQGVRMMSASKLKLGAVALALALLGTGLVTHQSLTAQAPLAQPAAGAGQNPFGGLRPAPAGSIDQRLADLEGRLEAALRDVRAVRQELKQAGGADLTTFRLKRASAAEAVRVLREVFGGTGARFDADERTNAVLVAAGERELREVRKVIEALDAERK